MIWTETAAARNAVPSPRAIKAARITDFLFIRIPSCERRRQTQRATTIYYINSQIGKVKSHDQAILGTPQCLIATIFLSHAQIALTEKDAGREVTW